MSVSHPPPAAATRVSFVVLSFNSERVLERCVRSLVDQAGANDRDEIWIVENGSSDGSPDVARSLQSEFPNVVNSIFLDRNCGTTVSRNMALERTKGQYLAIIDSDVVVPSGTIDALIAQLDAHPLIGLIAPRLVYPNGRLQLSVDQFPTLPHKVRRFLSLRAMEHRINRQPLPTGQREVDYAISAFWLMKRCLLEHVGMFDTRIFYAPEDVDYCLRTWKAGYAVVYDGSVHAVHEAQEISRGAPWRRIAISHVAGLFYLFRKHSYFLSRRRVYREIRHSDRTRLGMSAPGNRGQ